MFIQFLNSMEKHNKFEYFPQKIVKLYELDFLPLSILFTLQHPPIKMFAPLSFPINPEILLLGVIVSCLSQ